MSKKLAIGLSAIAAIVIVGAIGFGYSSVFSKEDETLPDFSRAVAVSDTVQASDGGGVQVQVTFDPQTVGQGETVSFLVSMSTHSVELGDYDIAELSQVTVDTGTALAEAVWTPEGAATGHHIQGTLTVADSSGLARTAKQIALEIKGLPGPDVRRFEWQVTGR